MRKDETNTYVGMPGGPALHEEASTRPARVEGRGAAAGEKTAITTGAGAERAPAANADAEPGVPAESLEQQSCSTPLVGARPVL